MQSSVFEQTDYSEFTPMEPPKYDINNLKDDKRKKDHLYSDIMTSGDKANRVSMKQSDSSVKDNKSQTHREFGVKAQVFE